jgi:hypothetical protein
MTIKHLPVLDHSEAETYETNLFLVLFTVHNAAMLTFKIKSL